LILRELVQKTDAELHEVVAEAKKGLYMYRMDKFRRKNPKARSKSIAKYRIVAAKSLIHARAMELQAKAEPEEPEEEEPPVMSSLMSKEHQINAFQQWDKKPGKLHRKVHPPKFQGEHWTPESRAWAEANIPVEEEEDTEEDAKEDAKEDGAEKPPAES